MPRHPRVHAEGVLYHAMAVRDNQEERVCQNCFALRDLGERRHHCCGIVLRQFASQVGTARRAEVDMNYSSYLSL